MAERKLCITKCGRYAVEGRLYCEICGSEIRVHHVHSKKAAKKAAKKKSRTMVKKAAKKAKKR